MTALHRLGGCCGVIASRPSKQRWVKATAWTHLLLILHHGASSPPSLNFVDERSGQIRIKHHDQHQQKIAIMIEPIPTCGIEPHPTRQTRKPELVREAKTVITFRAKAFGEKGLCDDLTLNLGDACAFGCSYCYVGPMLHKNNKRLLDRFNQSPERIHSTPCGHSDVIIRRGNALEILNGQLFDRKGRPKFDDPQDRRVIFSSTLVDVAGNLKLLQETAAACNLILENTH